MKKSVKNMSLPVIKDWQSRWMYDEKTLLRLLKKMPFKRQAKILTKALQIISNKNCSKDYAIARALDCRYEDAGYYSREKKIRL
jgi:hypothetical protein